jgi:hypothetical protein
MKILARIRIHGRSQQDNIFWSEREREERETDRERERERERKTERTTHTYACLCSRVRHHLEEDITISFRSRIWVWYSRGPTRHVNKPGCERDQNSKSREHDPAVTQTSIRSNECTCAHMRGGDQSVQGDFIFLEYVLLLRNMVTETRMFVLTSTCRQSGLGLPRSTRARTHARAQREREREREREGGGVGGARHCHALSYILGS